MHRALVLSLLLAAPLAAQEPPPPRPLDEVVAELVDALNRKDAEAIRALSAPILREHLPVDAVSEICGRLEAAVGAISGFERLDTRVAGQVRYLLDGEKGDVELVTSADRQGRLNLFSLRPPAPPPPPVAESEVPLRLPFRGEWTVLWGGVTDEDNHHLAHRNQRRAADLVVTDAEGRSHEGDGSRNEDYYAYGQDVLAAAGGEVVFAIDGVPDCQPGVLNPYAAVGNAVMVRHEDGHYAVYAHLIPGSVAVAKGDAVVAGQRLGLCGNSGNSSEPHLHFHIQDSPHLGDAWGVEAPFAGAVVTRDGEEATPDRYTFLRGDRVRPAGEAPAPEAGGGEGR